MDEAHSLVIGILESLYDSELSMRGHGVIFYLLLTCLLCFTCACFLNTPNEERRSWVTEGSLVFKRTHVPMQLDS